MWKVFLDDEGWFVSWNKPHPMPSRRRPTKAEAEAEASRRNELAASYERAVLEGTAGRLPTPKGGAR